LAFVLYNGCGRNIEFIQWRSTRRRLIWSSPPQGSFPSSSSLGEWRPSRTPPPTSTTTGCPSWWVGTVLLHHLHKKVCVVLSPRPWPMCDPSLSLSLPSDRGGWLLPHCPRVLQRVRHVCGHPLPLFLWVALQPAPSPSYILCHVWTPHQTICRLLTERPPTYTTLWAHWLPAENFPHFFKSPWCWAVTNSKMAWRQCAAFQHNSPWHPEFAAARCSTVSLQNACRCLLLACHLTLSLFFVSFLFLTSHNSPPSFILPTR